MNNCPHDIQLEAYHDGQLLPDQADAVRQHLSACAACSQKLGELSAMSSLFANVRRPVLLPIASMRLHQAVDSAIRNTMDGGLIRIAWALSSVAACILVAGSAWMIHVNNAPAAPQASATVDSPPWVAVATNADADSLVHEQASPVAQWYLADAGRRSDELP